MAKIIITIEDKADGTVAVVANPNFETMMKRNQSQSDLTAAHGYALCAIDAIRKAAKEESGKLPIYVPRIEIIK